MSACRSEKPRIKSGSSASILSNRALMNADTFGLLRASGGRTVYPEIPTTRAPSPMRYSVSVVSSVRQTMRHGYVEAIWHARIPDPGERLRDSRNVYFDHAISDRDRGSADAGGRVRRVGAEKSHASTQTGAA